jgi:Putative beta-barrel porin-2, OmpL-like. bbp2
MRQSLLVIFTFATMTLAAQLDSFITVTGSFDVYFRQNINSTSDATNGGTLAPATSFANLPGFAIGMANLKAAYNKNKVGLVADFVFGPRGKDAVFNSPSPLNLINQLYMSYQLNEDLTFTIGKFNTFVGYEVISPVGNTHYSTSYMFSYGPFNHTGLKATYALGKGFSLTAAIMNPTDFTDFNPSNTYFEGLQLAYAGDKTSAYFNTLYSKDFYQFDITATHKFSDKYALGLNATTAKSAFSGIALYNTYSATPNFDVAARVEYFQDKGLGILSGTNASVMDLTLSLGFKTNNFRLIPEFRIDLFGSDEKLKPIITDARTMERSDKLSSFVLAAITNF